MKETFFLLLANIEGWKAKFREFHWNALTLAEHKLCDIIMDSLTEFQDEFAEQGFPIFGKFPNGEFSGNFQYADTVEYGLDQLLTYINEIKLQILQSEFKDSTNFATLCDDFIGKLYKFKYLSTLK